MEISGQIAGDKSKKKIPSQTIAPVKRKSTQIGQRRKSIYYYIETVHQGKDEYNKITQLQVRNYTVRRGKIQSAKCFRCKAGVANIEGRTCRNKIVGKDITPLSWRFKNIDAIDEV